MLPIIRRIVATACRIDRCCHVTGILLVFFFSVLRASAQPAADASLFITVQNPLTSDEMSRIKDVTERARQHHQQHGDRERRLKIVYDFNPDNKASGAALFGPCSDLADYLVNLHDLTTIAFVHNEVTRHTVLPVLACSEIVMSSEGKLGDVMRDQGTVSAKYLREYEEIARKRGRAPAIVLKMLDPKLEIFQGKRADKSDGYVNKSEDAKKEGILSLNPTPIMAAGELGLFDHENARKLGLCQRRLESRHEVREAYEMPPSSLREDPLQGRNPSAWRIDVKEAVTPALVETLQRRIRRAIAQDANLLVLQLECSGGDTLEARKLADFLRTLKDNRQQFPVLTVAYIPDKASDTATFIAFGCSEIAMGEKAVLGDFDSLVYEGKGNDRRLRDAGKYNMVRKSLEGLAQDQGYSPLLARGMLDREVQIYRVHSREPLPERRLISEEELQADQAKDRRWVIDDLVKKGGRNGEFLRLTAEQAVKLQVAQLVVKDVKELYTHYGVKPGSVRETSPDWLDDVASFIRLPLVRVLLIMIGIVCLMLELKMPGVSLPLIIAAVCFLLFFWAHWDQGIIMLALFLFVLGLVLIILEIFVIPGFGVTGISGIVLILVGLGLATLEKKPETTQEWISFGSTLTTFGLGLVGAVGVALVIGRYLPHIPVANRMVLSPPGEKLDDLHEAAVEQVHERAALLGAIGVAATTLRPAGMAQFGDEYLDVVAEGNYLPAGTRVQVIEIEGNRIVVKEV